MTPSVLLTKKLLPQSHTTRWVSRRRPAFFELPPCCLPCIVMISLSGTWASTSGHIASTLLRDHLQSSPPGAPRRSWARLTDQLFTPCSFCQIDSGVRDIRWESPPPPWPAGSQSASPASRRAEAPCHAACPVAELGGRRCTLHRWCCLLILLWQRRKEEGPKTLLEMLGTNSWAQQPKRNPLDAKCCQPMPPTPEKYCCRS